MPDRSVLVRLRADVSNYQRNMATAGTSTSVFEKNVKSADSSINQLTGRLRLFGEIAASIGPSLTPIGGVALAGIGGVANQLGFAAIAGGVLIGSMQGLGDALDALNKAQLEPTAENLAKAEDALNRLSPAAADFAKQLSGLMPTLRAIRDMGAEELFPGLSQSLDNLERLGPRVGEIFASVAGALGDIASDATASLASDRWADFFLFIRDEAPRVVSELAATVGDLTHGLAELWQAFKPLNDDFSSWLMDVASGFDAWATGLDQTQGFQEFIDYIRTTGPQVAETFGAIGNALVQIVQATAPLGGPVLGIIETFADALGTIADSDLGTPILGGVAALSLLNRTLAVTASLSKVSLSSGLFSGAGQVTAGVKNQSGAFRSLAADLAVLGPRYSDVATRSERLAVASGSVRKNVGSMAGSLGKAAGPLAAMAVVSTGAADGLGLTNTASLALMGTIAGPWGAAVGGGIGLLMDWKAAGDRADEATAAFNASLQTLSLDQLNAGLVDLQSKLASLQQLGGITEDALTPVLEERKKAIEDQIEVTETLQDAQQAQEESDRGAAVALAQLAGRNVDVSNTAEQSVEQIKKQTKAFQQAQEAARESARGIAQAFFSVSAAVDASEGSLEKFIQSLEEQSRALADLQKSAKQAADKGIRKGLIAELEAAGPEGAVILKKLANATQSEMDRANAAYKRGQDAIRDYVNMKVPPKKITVEQAAAMTAIERIRFALASLKDKTVTVRVTQTGAAVTPGYGPVGSADGSMVPKDGGPYSDRFLYRLAPGEEIISNRHGEADRYRADRAAGRIPGYADGGTTGDSGGRAPRKLPAYLPAETAALIRQFGSLSKALKASERAVDRETRKRDAAAESLEATRAAFDDIAEATTAGFSGDPFAERAGAPRGTLGARASGSDPIAALNEDIAYGQRRGELQKQLQQAGLGGSTPGEQAALAEALKGANNDALAALLANGQAQQFEDLFIQRQGVIGDVGGQAGTMLFGGQMESQQVELAEQTAELREVKAELQALRREENARERRQADRARDNSDSNAAQVKDGVNSTAAVASRHNRHKRRPMAGAR